MPECKLRAHSFTDWLSIICGILIVIVLLIYCAWRVVISDENLKKHREYIENELRERQKYIVDRDVRWEGMYRENMEKQEKTVMLEQSILERLEALSAALNDRINKRH